MQGALPLLESLQRARDKRLKHEDSGTGLKVMIVERGKLDYQRLLPLFEKMMLDVDGAIGELRAELRRMAGGIVDSDHVVLNVRDYRDVYSLEPRVIMEQLRKRTRDEHYDNDTISSSSD